MLSAMPSSDDQTDRGSELRLKTMRRKRAGAALATHARSSISRSRTKVECWRRRTQQMKNATAGKRPEVFPESHLEPLNA